MAERIRIPADLNTEDVIAFGLSVRQLAILVGSVGLWFGFAKYFIGPILHLNIAFSMLATGWLPLIGLAFAFLKIRSRPLDVWLADFLAFKTQPDTYVLLNPGASSDLESDDDLDVMLRHVDRPRVIK